MHVGRGFNRPGATTVETLLTMEALWLSVPKRLATSWAHRYASLKPGSH